VRVIAGTFRSRRLKTPGKVRLRPTSDRLRETLFDVLGPSVEESLFLDLFAGTGAIGIEAISRGADQAIFVEANPAAARLIRTNLESLRIESRAQIIEADAERGLEKIAAQHRMAQFIFLDPPYEKQEDYLRVLEFLDSSRLVSPHGVVVAEHGRKVSLPERLDRLERTRVLVQGDAALSFYRLAAAA
jgi:16S rRNA (guanine966-N2)-methyltransferase